MKPRKEHFVWVLQDEGGNLWCYKGEKVVTFSYLKYARYSASALDPKRRWRAKRAAVIVTEVRQ